MSELAWLARDNEPDAGPWNTGLDGINLAGPRPEPSAEAETEAG